MFSLACDLKPDFTIVKNFGNEGRPSLFPAALFVFAAAAAWAWLVPADLAADDRSGCYHLPFGEVPAAFQFFEFAKLVMSGFIAVFSVSGDEFDLAERIFFAPSAADYLEPQPF